MSDQNATVRQVIVRGWPAQAEMTIVDPALGITYASFSTGEPEPDGGVRGIAEDPRQPFAARTADALARTAADQEHLRFLLVSHGVEVAGPVVLDDSGAGLDDAASVLAAHAIELEATEPTRIRDLVEQLAKLPGEALYALLCDWVEQVEQQGLGPDRETEGSYLWAAHPARANAYRTAVADHALATALLGDEQPQTDAAAAFARFRADCDPPLARYSFGATLRWIYFAHSEFADDRRAAQVPAALRLIAA